MTYEDMRLDVHLRGKIVIREWWEKAEDNSDNCFPRPVDLAVRKAGQLLHGWMVAPGCTKLGIRRTELRLELTGHMLAGGMCEILSK